MCVHVCERARDNVWVHALRAYLGVSVSADKSATRISGVLTRISRVITRISRV